MFDELATWLCKAPAEPVWDAWAAIGTVAAVLVALGIALRDAGARAKEARARARALSALIYVDVERVINYTAVLKKAVDEMTSAPYGTPAGATAVMKARTAYGVVVRDIRLDRLNSLADQFHLLPPNHAVDLSLAVSMVGQALYSADTAIQLFETGNPQRAATQLEAFSQMTSRVTDRLEPFARETEAEMRPFQASSSS